MPRNRHPLDTSYGTRARRPSGRRVWRMGWLGASRRLVQVESSHTIERVITRLGHNVGRSIYAPSTSRDAIPRSPDGCDAARCSWRRSPGPSCEDSDGTQFRRGCRPLCPRRWPSSRSACVRAAKGAGAVTRPRRPKSDSADLAASWLRNGPAGARRQEQQEHTGLGRGPGQRAALAAAAEAKRVASIESAKAQADRYRLSQPAGGGGRGSSTTSGSAVPKGAGACGRCGQLSDPRAAPMRDGRCRRCRDKPMCSDCGLHQPVKKSPWCRGCSLQHGWRVCTSCSKLFAPEPKASRLRRCQKCVKRGAGGRRGSGSSVHTVSGGLPTLGRRR